MLVRVTVLNSQDYEADGIDWTKVDFEDNQECLGLFEKVVCSHWDFSHYTRVFLLWHIINSMTSLDLDDNFPLSDAEASWAIIFTR